MELIHINLLRGKKHFLENILWDMTPKIFVHHGSAAKEGEKEPVNQDGYMFYIEVVNAKPVLVIMQNRFSMSQTVAYVDGVPDDLLRESANCAPEECVAGMFPLSNRLKDWLKQALGVT
jgi:hypothetical protein